ncbi:MAG: metallophosphoesterase [Oscillospiraceae bacterium]|nr:metallophosphoesterase [Oscillospiraceae bacterium]
MRIVVMSDSHRLFGPLQKIVEAQPEADIFIHLGDSETGCSRLEEMYPDKKFYFIRGNCDFNSELPGFLVIPLENKHRIFATHGHKYGVNWTKTELIDAAISNRCDIALYGHTHERCNSYENGIHILNPGSCSCPRDGLAPSYAYIDVVGDGIFKSHISL